MIIINEDEKHYIRVALITQKKGLFSHWNDYTVLVHHQVEFYF
jgi:hypothetical protein